MTLSLVGKDHEYKYLDLFAGEQKSPEFLKVRNWYDLNERALFGQDKILILFS